MRHQLTITIQEHYSKSATSKMLMTISMTNTSAVDIKGLRILFRLCYKEIFSDYLTT